ncbi:MAG: SulP family inorganic anion transporter [Acidobacteria bacterium]|nr:SulP family inorganic anion transporter [Acidobacteriota bacterium]
MILERLRSFNRIFDDRFEDLTADNWKSIIYRDFSAGLITAMTAIPMAMGFAMAAGMRPEQGIIAGAMACLVGRTWGGSKYQVYGPTAAFIPIIYAVMQKYDHGFLIAGSIIAGLILMILGLTGTGAIAKLVPNSIIVGFTVGIALTIAATNLYDVMGITTAATGGNLLAKLQGVISHAGELSGPALAIGLGTLVLTKGLLRISIFIPAPLLALGLGTLAAATIWKDAGLATIQSKFGSIPNNFFVFTPPSLPELTPAVMMDLGLLIFGVVFVSGVESVLCSSMADRMAGNRKTPFNPDKEFWGQGLVQVITPLINGFPCTGALARTATSIKAGAVTPLAGYFKFALKLVMAYYMAHLLEMVPMACIGGILLWVSSNMIKVKEIREVLATTKFHSALMIYTAVMVPMTDFLTGVLTALIIFAIGKRFFEDGAEEQKVSEKATVEA